MNDHQRTLELAASSIDFRLTPDEQQLIRTHLLRCDSCSVTVRGFRDDATRLAAMPHADAPAAVRTAVVGATVKRSGRASGMRWPLVAAMLAVSLVAGSFVAGSVVERLQGTLPAPTLPTIVDRTTPVPQPSVDQAPQPTPAAVVGWIDLGDITDEFGSRTVVSVMPAPDGGLLAFGIDRISTDAVVWHSDDGMHWAETVQPAGVFGGSGDVPTSGALTDAGISVVGWETTVEGRQRAIWTSEDGRSWSQTGLLGVGSDDLTLAAGPAGMIVWAPSGRAWVSTDGATWKAADIGRGGVTDVIVDGDRFVAVGRSGSTAFLTTSTNGRTWAKTDEQTAAPGAQVGIERAGNGTEVAWIGEQRMQRNGASWRQVDGGTMPGVPEAPTKRGAGPGHDPGAIVGGDRALVAMGTPTGGDTYRAWTSDTEGAWDLQRTDAERGTATPTVVASAPYEDGWFVLTRRGGNLHGWIVRP